MKNGINTIQGLQECLAMATKLGFATVPLYLCAEWSIKPAEDPDRRTNDAQRWSCRRCFTWAWR